MPRPKKAGAPQAKTRSRNGCWPCKARKVKCDETRPSCQSCQRQGEICDYSIRLNWEGRSKKKSDGDRGTGQISFSSVVNTLEPTSRNDPAKEKALEKCNSTQTYQDESSVETPIIPADVPSPNYDSQYDIPVPMPYSIYSRHKLAAFQPRTLSYPRKRPEPKSNTTTVIEPVLMAPQHRTAGLYRGRDSTRTQPSSDTQYVQRDEYYKPTELSNTTIVPQTAVSRVLKSPNTTNGILSASNSSVSNMCITTFGQSITPMTGRGICSAPSLTVERSRSPGVRPIVSSDRPSKRARLDLSDQYIKGSGMFWMPSPYSIPGFSHDTAHDNSPQTQQSSNGYQRTSMSPPGSVQNKLAPYAPQGTSDPRRLSVQSLLSGPPGIPDTQSSSHSTPQATETPPPALCTLSEEMTTWGVDRGLKDLDIDRNDDANAISGGSPVTLRAHLECISKTDDDYSPNEFGFGLQARDTTFEEGDYYERPVTIELPRSFEPLPMSLLSNPMNLLYFHHFISHTARILVPHHCSSNPFQNILPRMALEDENLMNILLAYSASHRARLLKQLEPATRIALWVQDVFPNLRHALDDPTKILTNSNLAAAIMLASLEIISPKAFGVAVPWQQHLATARQMIVARGGASSMNRDRSSSSAFLLKWFGYLDVLGSLVGGNRGLPLSAGTTWALEYVADEEGDFYINCLLGFTGRCVSILGKIADLAQEHVIERSKMDEVARASWTPSTEMRQYAERLIADLESSRTNTRVQHCPHLHSSGEAETTWDNGEISATNEAYHWAGAIHIHRRILGKQTLHPDVQNAVQQIVNTLGKIRKGSTAEVCLLFPMFTAGCDSQDDKQRAVIMERMRGIEDIGMSQVYKAKTLMQKVWATNMPWEALVSGEFVG